MRALASRLLSEARGIAAVEFAIGAPVLIFGVLAMIDAGMAAATRMEIDRNVRSGAQAAMSLNNDPAAIRSIVLAAAGEPADLSVDVAKVCECEGAEASCTVPCDSGEAPSVFFDIAGQRPYAGILVDLAINSRARVQIR